MDLFLRRVVEQREREQAVMGPLDVLQRLDEERLRVLTVLTQPRRCLACAKLIRSQNPDTRHCTKCGGQKRSMREKVVSERN